MQAEGRGFDPLTLHPRRTGSIPGGTTQARGVYTEGDGPIGGVMGSTLGFHGGITIRSRAARTPATGSPATSEGYSRGSRGLVANQLGCNRCEGSNPSPSAHKNRPPWHPSGWKYRRRPRRHFTALEGTAKWLATGLEPLGGREAGRSIRLPSARGGNSEIAPRAGRSGAGVIRATGAVSTRPTPPRS